MKTARVKIMGYFALMLCGAYLGVCSHATGEPPPVIVIGAISDKWAALKAGNGILGQPMSNEQPTFDGKGRWQQFQKGIISWHPTTGAHPVSGLFCELWLKAGREKFGYPITDELFTPDKRGHYQHFRALQLPQDPEASIYWSKSTGGHIVYGGIRARWAALGWERGKLGFPTSDEHDVMVGGAKGRQSDFQRGYILSSKAGVHESIAQAIDGGTALVPASE